MYCTLLIPDLLLPREFGAEPYAGLRLPSLEKLLARGNSVRSPAVATEDWLCDRFGVSRQQDRPVAPLMLNADGVDPQRHYWLCADPVQLRVDRSRVVITGSATDFSVEETRDLIATLNEHFCVDGVNFFAPTPARWYVRAQGNPRLVTTPLAQALNRNVEHHLPRGDDARVWHRVMNEAQMIMHTHPVNTAREERGAPVANSIWLWGGGTLPVVPPPPYAAMWGSNSLMRALAAGAGIVHNQLPANGSDWLADATDAHHLIVIDAPATAVRAGDAAEWRKQLVMLDQQWVRPLLDAVQSKQISALALVSCNSETLLESNIAPPDLWRFWRRVRPLAAYTGHP
jgi:hypothetical protein